MSEEIARFFRKGVADLGPRSFGPPLESLKKQLGLDDLINMSLNENAMGPSPHVITAILNGVEKVNRYPDPGATELRAVIAEKNHVDVEQVLIGNGGSELISLVAEVFLNEGEELLTPDPTFRQFQGAAKIMGGVVKKSMLKDYRINLADMADLLSPRTKLVILVNPNNPTGDILRKEEVDAFMEKVGKNRIVVFDQAYEEYVADSGYANGMDFIKKGYPAVILRTLSKAHGLAGMRVGYAISSPEMIALMEPARNVFNTSRLAQIAAIAALNDEEHLTKCVQVCRESKQYYYHEFDRMGLSYVPTSANFIFVNVNVDDVKLHEVMKKKGILISPGSWSDYKGMIRITFGTPEQNKRCITCLKESLSEMA